MSAAALQDVRAASHHLFAEAAAWKSIAPGWRPLFSRYRDLGFSFEWHEFEVADEFNWARSFHPGSVELCLNLEGQGRLSDENLDIEISPGMFSFYFQGSPPLRATRKARDHHCFITVEFSPEFLRQHFKSSMAGVHPLVNSVLRSGMAGSAVAAPERLSPILMQIVESLRHCPVFALAQELWFRSKALEIASHLLFRPAEGELFCTRTQRLARERVEKAKNLLRERMQNPPSLEELARLVSCSPFYLSRQFAENGGMTMQRFLRQIRMDRAAELLRTGRCNVTEAALEVGYNSLSHFSTAFHEVFGCCPGLYPMKTRSQCGPSRHPPG